MEEKIYREYVSILKEELQCAMGCTEPIAVAYCAALVVYQLGGLITGEIGFNFFTIVAAVVLVAFIYLMVRPNKYVGDNEVKIDVSKIK